MPRQDLTVVGQTADGKPVFFQHPAFQSACMFLGGCGKANHVLQAPGWWWRWLLMGLPRAGVMGPYPLAFLPRPSARRPPVPRMPLIPMPLLPLNSPPYLDLQGRLCASSPTSC